MSYAFQFSHCNTNFNIFWVSVVHISVSVVQAQPVRKLEVAPSVILLKFTMLHAYKTLQTYQNPMLMK